MYVCVCEREREGGKEGGREGGREREREREREMGNEGKCGIDAKKHVKTTGGREINHDNT